MAGSSALDGGRILKVALFLLGALVTAPAMAQPATDPLLPATAPAQPAPTVAPAAAPISSARVPRDWRGVFDAIDAGDWAGAQAGIAALPPSVLTPVAKAELYTAKGSPTVDAASLQALIAQAPELPDADQLAAMAFKRGATDPIRVWPEKPTT